MSHIHHGTIYRILFFLLLWGTLKQRLNVRLFTSVCVFFKLCNTVAPLFQLFFSGRQCTIGTPPCFHPNNRLGPSNFVLTHRIRINVVADRIVNCQRWICLWPRGITSSGFFSCRPHNGWCAIVDYPLLMSPTAVSCGTFKKDGKMRND